MRIQTNRTTELGHIETKEAQPSTAHAGDIGLDRSPGPRKGWFARLMSTLSPTDSGSAHGSLDGEGAADHDQPYRFGFRPRAVAPYPFNTRQYARLLVLRGRIQDHVGPSLELVPVEMRDFRPAA